MILQLEKHDTMTYLDPQSEKKYNNLFLLWSIHESKHQPHKLFWTNCHLDKEQDIIVATNYY
mgnify:CR=1 FL=1